jgi:hypothetical protein
MQDEVNSVGAPLRPNKGQKLLRAPVTRREHQIKDDAGPNDFRRVNLEVAQLYERSAYEHLSVVHIHRYRRATRTFQMLPSKMCAVEHRGFAISGPGQFRVGCDRVSRKKFGANIYHTASQTRLVLAI